MLTMPGGGLKDADSNASLNQADDIIKDDVGGRVRFQIGETIARGIEVCVLHHQRKAQQS
jgi:hypothetical protein